MARHASAGGRTAAAHPHAVVYAQAPRGLPCRLEPSEGEIVGQLRRLSYPGDGGQFSRTRDRPALG